MRQVKQVKKNRPIKTAQAYQRLREGLLILMIAAAFFLFVSICTWNPADPGWLGTGSNAHHISNWGGKVGAFLADILLFLSGYVAWVLPLLVIFVAWTALKEKLEQSTSFATATTFLKIIGFIFITLSSCGLMTLYWKTLPGWLPASSGGLIGEVIAQSLKRIFNVIGSAIFLLGIFFSGVTLLTGLSWLGIVNVIGLYVTQLFSRSVPLVRMKMQILKQKFLSQKFKNKDIKKPLIIEPKLVKSEIKPIVSSENKIIKPSVPVIKMQPEKISPPMSPPSSVHLSTGMLPPLILLDPPSPTAGKAFSDVSFEELSQLVEQRLLDFGVEVKVVAVHPGPIITRFELDLAPGIKVSKITGLAKDIARSLSASSVRVVEVIPGKSVIGLELPNQHREVVGLREILECSRYAQARSPVSLVLGKDIAGFPVVVDLAKMPHLLVAGTTGSGKSVSINAMLLSMLFKATPEQLRLILIDPKMLELSVYEGIPHLLTPVITDMKDASNALRWCVAEMDRRYRLMASLGVRNLASFNTKVTDAIKQKQPIPAPEWFTVNGKSVPHLDTLPTIVVVADELADMMMVVGKKVEDLIARIAQKARASGIHLILATQRPSVDVITGLIKANIPTRIAFQVSSRIDSRTILDQQGAEQLLGNGDMLYMPPGTSLPVRVHGAFVGDDEVHRVVAAWHTYGKPDYLEEVTGDHEASSDAASDEEVDPLYDQALQIVTESRRASISLVQRRLKIGYNRAARIMEEMEAAGVVSIMDSNGLREVIAPEPV